MTENDSNIPTITIPDIKNGIVVIMDALGSSALSPDEAQIFFRNRQRFLHTRAAFSFKLKWINQELRDEITGPKVFSFGDVSKNVRKSELVNSTFNPLISILLLPYSRQILHTSFSR